MEKNLLAISNLNLTYDWRLNRGKAPIPVLEIEPDEQGKVTQYVKRVYLKRKHTYELSLEVKCTEYSRGELGVAIDGLAETLAVTEVSADFIHLQTRLCFSEDKELRFFVGGLRNAKLVGAIRRLQLLDMTAEQAQHLPVNKEEPQQAFIHEMNAKCQLWGMASTHFVNASGLVAPGQLTTARDMARLTMEVTKYPALLGICKTKDYKVSFMGPHERQIKIHTLVENADFESRYPILGTKSGTLLPNVFHLVMLTKDEEDQVFITVIMQTTSKNNRFAETEKLLQIAKEKRTKEANLTKDFEACSGAVYQLKNSVLALPEVFGQEIYVFNGDKKIKPASLTKLMTALVVIENVSNLNERFEVKACDLIDTSGPLLLPGDWVSYQDALYILLLTSCNSMAQALSRVIGERLRSFQYPSS